MRLAVRCPQPLRPAASSYVVLARIGPIPGGTHGGAAHPETPGGTAYLPSVLQETPDGLHLLR